MFNWRKSERKDASLSVSAQGGIQSSILLFVCNFLQIFSTFIFADSVSLFQHLFSVREFEAKFVAIPLLARTRPQFLSLHYGEDSLNQVVDHLRENVALTQTFLKGLWSIIESFLGFSTFQLRCQGYLLLLF